MKKSLFRFVPLMMLFVLSSGFTHAPSDGDAVVLIDGKQVTAESTLIFDRDDTVYLEATGIKPNSSIYIKVKKLGIRWFEDNYEVDKTGEVKGVMQIPEEKLSVNCTVTYYSSDGKFHEVEFKFKTV